MLTDCCFSRFQWNSIWVYWHGSNSRVGPNWMSWIFYSDTPVPTSLRAVGVAQRDPKFEWWGHCIWQARGGLLLIGGSAQERTKRQKTRAWLGPRLNLQGWTFGKNLSPWKCSAKNLPYSSSGHKWRLLPVLFLLKLRVGGLTVFWLTCWRYSMLTVCKRHK